tara:strand:+ start:81 stop:599 length:519 start_codon:yes stop_codon:yes gene_type:complete
MIVYAKNNRRKRLTTIFTIFVLCLVCLIVNNNIKLVVGDDEHEEEHLDTEDEEDMKEVEAIVNQTDIIKMIVQQKQRHEVSLREMDEKIEEQIMSFYDKHDEALSEFRDIDHNLRDRIQILEATVMAEVKTLSSKKTNRWAWLFPFCIIMTLLGAFAAYSRGKLKRLRAASF